VKIKDGISFISATNSEIENAEAYILLLSNSVWESTRVQKEISQILFGEISKSGKIIIPVLIDNFKMPQYLANYQHVDLTRNYDHGIESVFHILSNIPQIVCPPNVEIEKRNDRINKDLSQSLKDGRLTLIIGAGCSVDAGIPKWDDLLLRLLNSLVKKKNQEYSKLMNNINPIEFKNRYNVSPLVLGKNLKFTFKAEFQSELRNALYLKSLDTSKMIDAIISLSRPSRGGKSLESIITFNFDSLIEENLEKNEIKYKTIYSEGNRYSQNEIPIYHIHGYIPRTGKLTDENEVVFSEDSYHSQFIDPYTWSNLILLNKLSHNTCLLVGLSLKDPNLRRLLDISFRKNPQKNLNHYVIMEMPNMGNIKDNIDELALRIEEQDFNTLGLNVRWIDNYDEIPDILEKINN
jgi:hypothetical protein